MTGGGGYCEAMMNGGEREGETTGPGKLYSEDRGQQDKPSFLHEAFLVVCNIGR